MDTGKWAVSQWVQQMMAVEKLVVGSKKRLYSTGVARRRLQPDGHETEWGG